MTLPGSSHESQAQSRLSSNQEPKGGMKMDQHQHIATQETRSIARQLARVLRPEELDGIAAGTTSCSCGRCDDCDLEKM